MASAVEQLITTLKAASHAYYNGGSLLMTDQEFDTAVDKLRTLDPDHPFLQEIGAPPVASEETVQLPFLMPSLDKLKLGQEALARFIGAKGPFVVSEKLDGLSALWIPAKKALYLRGNGLTGQSISRFVPLGIQGLPTTLSGAQTTVRGEVVVAREGRPLARSWVNGILHQTSPTPADVQQLRFVAYEVLEPSGMSRSQQFTWLQNQGYEVPWSNQLQTTTEQELATLLQKRRSEGRYDTDGLVIGQDVWEPPLGQDKKLRNPKTLFAFKMALSDQSATTTVREILWAPSAQGYLIPRIQFDPVLIGGATIQFCTGHHARMVHDNGLGPGAVIVIRRSGDVIPTLDRVVTPAPTGPSFPSEGTWAWISGDAQQATHIRTTNTEGNESQVARLHHFCKTLGIPGAAAATATTLVKSGYASPRQLLAASKEALTGLLGPTNGPNFYTKLREALAAATEATLWIASSKLPRGVGEAKLQPLFACNPDPRSWTTGQPIPGWSAQALETFLATVPSYVAWRAAELPEFPFPISLQQQPIRSVLPSSTQIVACFTGFRDTAIEAQFMAKGHRITDTVTSKTKVLVVPDGDHVISSKEKAAREKGISVLPRSVFIIQYL